LFEECLRKKDFVPREPKGSLLEDNDFQDFEHEEYYRGCHLFVFVHGFQATSVDMKLLKNSISMVHPEAIFLLSKKNENETEGDIAEMGVRLADEVNEFIEQYCPGSSLGRLSFIAHSMGGLIVRSALPYLEKFKGLMHTFMTLGSPHLGYMYYNSSKLVDAGMWVLKKWKKSVSLDQMCMTDHSDLKETFLFQLSTKPGFEWFKNILLVSSFEDMYAPFDSARIQICSKASKDVNRGNIYIQMAANLLNKLEVECLYRVDVNFMLPKNVLFASPRAAHIQFLENKIFMNMLIFRFKEFFE
jgi:pimeloyl-ACP methyl ester carboxylesterase